MEEKRKMINVDSISANEVNFDFLMTVAQIFHTLVLISHEGIFSPGLRIFINGSVLGFGVNEAAPEVEFILIGGFYSE